mgnify:CR=1 FL=1
MPLGMLDALLPAIVVLVIVVVLVGVLKLVLLKGAPAGAVPYEAADGLFTPAERSFLGVLDQALSPDLRVFGKVRAADVMKVRSGMNRSDWQRAFNRIKSKHFDFVICRSSDLAVLLLIELDDKSHQKRQRAERDAFIERAVQAAGIPLLRIPCKKSYSVQEVVQLLQAHLQPPSAAAQPEGGEPPPVPAP